MKVVMEHTGLKRIQAVVPNEIGGIAPFEALRAAHHFRVSVLDTDLVARAYPMVYQSVRCLNNIPLTPAAISDGIGTTRIFTTPDNFKAEEEMRKASVELGSLSGFCTNPVFGIEAKTLPPNSFSHGRVTPGFLLRTY